MINMDFPDISLAGIRLSVLKRIFILMAIFVTIKESRLYTKERILQKRIAKQNFVLIVQREKRNVYLQRVI